MIIRVIKIKQKKEEAKSSLIDKFSY